MKGELQRRRIPFPFVIDELESLRPTVRTVFGFTHVYLEDKLLFSLRDNTTQPGSNGMWLYTTTEYADDLAREFTDLPRRQIWRSGKKAWIILASRLPEFEEHAFKACELILGRDQRIGRLSRRMTPGDVEGSVERGRYSKRNRQVARNTENARKKLFRSDDSL